MGDLLQVLDWTRPERDQIAGSFTDSDREIEAKQTGDASCKVQTGWETAPVLGGGNEGYSVQYSVPVLYVVYGLRT